MFSPEVIHAGAIRLRPAAEGDVEAIVRACSDPLIVRFIPAIPAPYTREDALAYLTAAERTWQAGGAEFAIADPGTDAWLGNIGLKPPGPRGDVEIGYLVAPWARGKGVATAAARAVAEWAFARGVHRLELLANVENIASQKVAYAAAFTREGVRRGAEPYGDGHRDLVAFARLRHDPADPIRPCLPFPADWALTDGVVLLTPITVDDAIPLHRMMVDPDVLRHHDPPSPPGLAEITDRCRRTGMWWLAGERVELAVRDAATGEFAGHIQLTHIRPHTGEALLGYALLAHHRGRGLATRAVRLLVSWAFAHTPITHVTAGTDPANTASHRVLERAGFTREGRLRGPSGALGHDLRWVRSRA